MRLLKVKDRTLFLRLKRRGNAPVIIIGSAAPTPEHATSNVRLAKLAITATG